MTRRRALRRAREQAADRVEQVCRREFGTDRMWDRWSEVLAFGDPDHPTRPTRARVLVPVGRIDRPRFQEEMDRWTGQRWRYAWRDPTLADPRYGELVLTPSPTGLDLGAPDHLFHPHADGILLGETLDGGHPVHWQPNHQPSHTPGAVVLDSPHLGVLGATGLGKSVLLRVAGAGALARGARLAIGDFPKGTGFLPFLGRTPDDPDPAWVARELPEVVRMLHFAWDVAGGRFDLMWEGRGELDMAAVIEADQGALYVVLDEFPRLRPHRHDSTETKRLKDEARGLAYDLLGAAREAWVHLVLGAQQGNAEVFGTTEQRSNLRAMVSAWQEPEGARQARLPAAARLDPDEPGRWVAAARGRTWEFTAYHLPPTGSYLRDRFAPGPGEWPPTSSATEPRPSTPSRRRRDAIARPGGEAHRGTGP